MSARFSGGDVFQDLRTAMLDLAIELKKYEILLIIGGGYGLFLWQIHMIQRLKAQEKIRPLLESDTWPQPRSTQDLDVFLTGEVITDYERFAVIRNCLGALGYTSVEGRHHWQFEKELSGSKKVLIDIITGPVDDYKGKVRIENRRVSPRRFPESDGSLPKKVKMHARFNKEALNIDSGLRRVEVNGLLSTGEAAEAVVGVPHPFQFLVMKLNAYEDQKEKADLEFGSHHALDIFRIVSMLTSEEFSEVKLKWAEHVNQTSVNRASEIIRNDFEMDALGVDRLRIHELGKGWSDDHVDRACRALQNIASSGARVKN